MPANNIEIAAMLNRMADLMEIEGANVFRIRAYRNAAQLIADTARNVSDMVAAGEDLSELPGIGTSLAEHIVEIVRTGRFAALEKEAKRVPASLGSSCGYPRSAPSGWTGSG